MTRRIVQIAADSHEQGGLYALFDDGSLRVLKPGIGWTAVVEDIDAPADPDPIAELEAMGGFITSLDYGESVGWTVQIGPKWDSEASSEALTRSPDLRAAAARLLARIRGAQ